MSESVRSLAVSPLARTPRAAPPLRAGVIVNPRSHRNRVGSARPTPANVLTANVGHEGALDQSLAMFARRGLELLVIDGGDGTIRDVLTAAARHFGASLPPLAVLPSGKTNALALDLGVPAGWSLEDALQCAREGRFLRRAALEVWRPGGQLPEHRGFLFGTGAFVRATQAAQAVHRLGAFDAAAVAMTIGSSAVRTLFGGPRDAWRAGDPAGLTIDDELMDVRSRFIVTATTLERLPLGLKPFGRPRNGMKVLSVDAPPRRLHAALLPVLSGREPDWLEAAGYRRTDAEALRLSLTAPFVLDGEVFPGGEFTVRKGDDLEFASPRVAAP